MHQHDKQTPGDPRSSKVPVAPARDGSGKAPERLRNALTQAITSGDTDTIDNTLELVWLSEDITPFLDILNGLLIDPNHRSHQRIAKHLQDKAPDASTVPFIRKALESDFRYLDYTASDPGAIAKWFSWLLAAIGTPEAIALIEEFSNCGDEEVQAEMRYRLRKIRTAGTRTV